MAEVVVSRSHEGGEVGVASHQGNGLAGRDVEVARDLVQGQASVDPARIVGIVWDLASEREERNVGLALSDTRDAFF